MLSNMPPFAIFYIAALFVPFLRGRVRSALMLAVPIVSFFFLLNLDPTPNPTELNILGYTLNPVRVDKLSMLFGYLFHIAGFIAIMFSLHVKDTGQHIAGLTYIGSALGAVFAGDLISLFVFWELLAITSVFLIWARGTQRAINSGLRYLLIQVGSGVLLLAGSVMHIYETGSIEFSFIGMEGGLSSWLILLAFGIKCAFPFMHNWLTDAYPEATPTGTVFLSALTTKVAVYVLARSFAGTEFLVYVGCAMAVFPIFYAVIENDLRRVLAYSMINQIGFMVCGIGIGTELAINGAVAHAFNDVIFKGLLMMSMGAVLHQTGKINGSELGGLYKSMPFTTVFCIIGAASISAFPLFSGFVSKAMVMSALLYEHYNVVWLFMLFSAAGVFHHAGIKIPFFAFFAHDSGIRVPKPPINMLIAMAIGAVLCIGIGCFPQVLYQLLPYDKEYHPYDGTHILTQLQLLFFSAAAFVFLNLKGLYPPELPSVNLDFEWLYRKVIPWAVGGFGAVIAAVDSNFRKLFVAGLNRFLKGVGETFGEKGLMGRTWATSTMAIWAAILLGVCLLIYYS